MSEANTGIEIDGLFWGLAEFLLFFSKNCDKPN